MHPILRVEYRQARNVRAPHSAGRVSAEARNVRAPHSAGRVSAVRNVRAPHSAGRVSAEASIRASHSAGRVSAEARNVRASILRVEFCFAANKCRRWSVARDQPN